MIQRFSVSVEDSLLEQFDDHIARRAYQNRSEAIRDLIRDALVREDWETNRQVIGVITLVYDHSIPRLQNIITHMQHDSHDRIVATTHVHVDHDNCLEVIIVNGSARDVVQLKDTLASVRGVRNCTLSTTGTSGDASASESTHVHGGHHHDHGPRDEAGGVT